MSCGRERAPWCLPTTAPRWPSTRERNPSHDHSTTAAGHPGGLLRRRGPGRRGDVLAGGRAPLPSGRPGAGHRRRGDLALPRQGRAGGGPPGAGAGAGGVGVTPPVALARGPLAREPELRRALAARESYAYAAASGMLRKALKGNRDRPEKAIRIALATLSRWSSSCDWIAADGAPPEPAEGAAYRVRLTVKGEAALAALRASGGVR